jgi:hypothetical protein
MHTSTDKFSEIMLEFLGLTADKMGFNVVISYLFYTSYRLLII